MFTVREKPATLLFVCVIIAFALPMFAQDKSKDGPFTQPPNDDEIKDARGQIYEYPPGYKNYPIFTPTFTKPELHKLVKETLAELGYKYVYKNDWYVITSKTCPERIGIQIQRKKYRDDADKVYMQTTSILIRYKRTPKDIDDAALLQEDVLLFYRYIGKKIIELRLHKSVLTV
jgi:hypothetical protein